MQYLEPLFELPNEIRKSIYTSNAIEAVNSALRKVTRGKGAFPSESSVYKVLYLRIKELKEKWRKPIQNKGFLILTVKVKMIAKKLYFVKNFCYNLFKRWHYGKIL